MAVRFSFIVEQPEQRLDVFLVEKTSRTRAFVQEGIKAGGVSRNGQPITKPSQKLRVGDVIAGELVEPTVAAAPVPVKGNLEILYEDDTLLIIQKPQGLVVHPAAGTRDDTLVHYLLHHFASDPKFSELDASRPGIVHRLDRGTSGLMLIARNREAQESLSRLFKQREIKKEYEAIAWGRMKERGIFRSVIGRDKRDRKKMSSRTDQGRDALTHWERAAQFAHFAHVNLFPHTGRTHQLRVHLAEAGTPIAGDATYGGRATSRARSLPAEVAQFLEGIKHPFLHARCLSFTHPVTGKALRFEAKRPEIFQTFLDLLARRDP